MFVSRFINFLRGYIVFSAIGANTERLINEFVTAGIKVWNIRMDRGVLYAEAYAADYEQITELCTRNTMGTELVRQRSMAQSLGKYKGRVGIVLGAAVFTVFLFIMQSFIWDIEIIGNTAISAESLEASLELLGIRKGAFKHSIDFRDCENKMLSLYNEIAWLAINNRGSRVVLEINEGTKSPEFLSASIPCNIVAAKDGWIVSVEVYSGTKMVNDGDYIIAGDLIISGVVEDSVGNIFMRHAAGKVIARTEAVTEIVQPLVVSQTEYTGKIKKRRIFEAFGLKIPLFIAGRVSGEYEQSTSQSRLRLFGNELPFSVYTNEYVFYTTREITISEEEAIAIAEQEVKRFAAVQLRDSRIIASQEEQRLEDGVFYKKVTFLCEEDITKQQEIKLS
ncbi:MAG: sporulation protein YqfD [Oscillospiraceae bacterium]|nr:sporulation protein YqfD [Oscillospiraceae bacterium]